MSCRIRASFANSCAEDSCKDLMKAGKPLVFTAALPILENKWYGTQGGFNVLASEGTRGR